MFRAFAVAFVSVLAIFAYGAEVIDDIMRAFVALRHIAEMTILMTGLKRLK